MRKEILSLGVIFGIILIMPFASGQLFEKAKFQESALVTVSYTHLTLPTKA